MEAAPAAASVLYGSFIRAHRNRYRSLIGIAPMPFAPICKRDLRATATPQMTSWVVERMSAKLFAARFRTAFEGLCREEGEIDESGRLAAGDVRAGARQHRSLLLVRLRLRRNLRIPLR